MVVQSAERALSTVSLGSLVHRRLLARKLYVNCGGRVTVRGVSHFHAGGHIDVADVHDEIGNYFVPGARGTLGRLGRLWK